MTRPAPGTHRYSDASVDRIVSTATSDGSLTLPSIPTSGQDFEDEIHRLSQAFDRNINWARWGAGLVPVIGGNASYDTWQRRPLIDSIAASVNSLDGNMNDSNLSRRAIPGHVDAGLVAAIYRVEREFNNDIIPFQTSTPPMNVNYGVWGQLLQEHGIERWMISTESGNIQAASVILSYLDASIPSNITGDARLALIASMYGNTELALGSGINNYGAKVMEYLREDRRNANQPEIQYGNNTITNVRVNSRIANPLIGRDKTGDLAQALGLDSDASDAAIMERLTIAAAAAGDNRFGVNTQQLANGLSIDEINRIDMNSLRDATRGFSGVRLDENGGNIASAAEIRAMRQVINTPAEGQGR